MTHSAPRSCVAAGAALADASLIAVTTVTSSRPHQRHRQLRPCLRRQRGPASATGTGSAATASNDSSIDAAFASGTRGDALSSDGIFNTASADGTGLAAASGGNFDSALLINLTKTAASATAEFGEGNDAFVLGGSGSCGWLERRSSRKNDIAPTFGNFDNALAGASATDPGNFDLAAASGDMLYPAATWGCLPDRYRADLVLTLSAGAQAAWGAELLECP